MARKGGLNWEVIGRKNCVHNDFGGGGEHLQAKSRSQGIRLWDQRLKGGEKRKPTWEGKKGEREKTGGGGERRF